MKMNNFFQLIFAIGFSFLVNSAQAGIEKGYVLTTGIWPITLPTTQIPVCWINPTAADQAKRAIVQNAVARTWEAVSNVRFVGWAECPMPFDITTNKSIRILIEESWPRSVVGKSITNISPGMHLNFTFTDPIWSACSTSISQINYCIDAIAVHEFGHALGFAHEQNRPDTPSWCNDQEPRSGTFGNFTIGNWDAESVMNYCNSKWNGNGNLSATDILTVQTYYGKPNTNPVAKFSSSFYGVAVKKSLRLDGAKSYDPEGGALNYSWRFGDTSTTAQTTVPYIDHIFNVEGNFAVFLTVDDFVNTSQPAVSYVTVYDPVKVLVPIYSLLLN